VRFQGKAMQSDSVSVRVNFGSKEVEVAGSNQEVVEWWERLAPILADLAHSPSSSAKKTDTAPGDSSVGKQSTPESFGEYFHEFPSSITDVEKMLVAAFFAQTTEADTCFTTGQASKLLSDQGIKLGNPSQCVKQNAEKKHVFAHNGKYRVSKSGIEHLNSLKVAHT